MTENRGVEGLIVVGGGPAGHAAATAYREAGGDGRVLVLSADHALPYERPPLSKQFLRAELDEDGLFLGSRDEYREHDIEFVLDADVTALSVDDRTVRVGSGEVYGFRQCVLATGCAPSPLPVPGGDHPRVRSLRSLDQARRLRSEAANARTAVVIGSGFIGCEAAVSLAARGLDVTMVSPEAVPQARRLGEAAGHRILDWLRAAGVRYHGGADVGEIRDGTTVVTTDGRSREADVLLAAVGASPRSELAVASGLPVRDGRILVDADMRSVAGFFAAGDVVSAHNTAAGRRLEVEHWGEALRMGEIAGRNAAGGDESWAQAPGFWSTLGERTLKYVAWGDGFDTAQLVDHGNGGFTVWYSTEGVAVGVLTHRADADYERGRELIEAGRPVPVH